MITSNSNDIIYYLLTELQELASTRRLSLKELCKGTPVPACSLYAMIKSSRETKGENIAKLINIDKFLQLFKYYGYEINVELVKSRNYTRAGN